MAAARYVRGEVWLKRYRGRAAPQAAQAAEHFLRTHTATGSVAAVTIESVRDAQVTEAQVTEVVADWAENVTWRASHECRLTRAAVP